VRHADKILARLAEAEAELEAIAGLRGGRLRLATFPTAGATLVPRAIREFSQRHPAVELTLTEGEPNESLPRLKVGELDLVLVDDSSHVQEAADEDVELIHLLDDPLHLVLPADHPLVSKQRVRMSDLEAEQWIQSTTTCACRRHVQTACSTAGFEPRVAYESDDFQVVQGLVAAGVGVALIPGLGLVSERPDVVIRPIGPRAPFRKILAAALANGYRSPAVTEMLEILQGIAADYESAQPSLVAAS
jgi:DNA-binding transcriptional LysR family regulator